MTLADEVRNLAAQSTAALNVSHDYYTFTKRVWRTMQRAIEKGRMFRMSNVATGTVVNQQALLTQWQDYGIRQLSSSTFQHFLSLFEEFFFDLLRLWLTAYPGSLSRKQLEFTTVLRAADKAAIIAQVIERELNELKYERVADWFAYLERLAKLGTPAAEAIAKLAEMKAARDMFVHNKNIANATYVEKAGALARFKVGEIIELPEPYHRDCWEAIKKIVQDLADAVIAKDHSPA